MKQEEIRRRAQELTSSLKFKTAGGETDLEMEAAVCKIFEAILPNVNGEQSREETLKNLSRLTEWVEKMPQSLHPDRRWSREEFDAVLAGPAEEDARFEDYMDAFYEEYLDESENEARDFYDKLFQNEGQIDEVDWVAIWESVRHSYEHWLENGEEDEWLKGEKFQVLTEN